MRPDSHYLRSISDTLAARAESGQPLTPTECAEMARDLGRLADALTMPAPQPPGSFPIAAHTLRNAGTRTQMTAALTERGQMPQPELLRLTAIHLHDAADRIEELEGKLRLYLGGF